MESLYWFCFHANTFSDVNRMKLLVNDDPTTLSYWLNWRVFLCAVWVLAPMVIAAFIIWKHEHSGNSESDAGGNQQESSHIRSEKSWKPCLKEIHPVFLLCFRIIAFGLLLIAVSFDLALHGAELFHYYTQWVLLPLVIVFWTESCFKAPENS